MKINELIFEEYGVIGSIWRSKYTGNLFQIYSKDDNGVYLKSCPSGELNIFVPNQQFIYEYRLPSYLVGPDTFSQDEYKSQDVENDNVNNHETPSHYDLDPEPIDVIKSWGLDFCLGNVIKYIARAGNKVGETKDKDLHKAMEYLRIELED